MLAWVLDQALALQPERVVLVVGHGVEEVERALAADGRRDAVALVRQEPQLGTGHALQVAAPALTAGGRAPGAVVVLYGDMPCLRAGSLAGLCAARAELGAKGSVLLSTHLLDPTGYGRVLRDEDGGLARIVEEQDASEDERAIAEVNLGVYAFAGNELLARLPGLATANAQGEYYLTDVAGMLVADGLPVEVLELEDPDEALGVNTLAQLADARWVLQQRILEEHLERGVFIEDPASVWIDWGVTIGAGTRILPSTVIRSGVVIGAGCEVGPFTHLREGTVLEDGAEVGNFTECKQARLGEHAKAKHLSYLGDVAVGARANIGAGTIFANYDGKRKHRCEVGERAFVGSGTVVVAPNVIGAGAVTGAGAVVTRGADVGPGEVWVGVPARKLRGPERGGAAREEARE
jgi:bifunctional UDP-N-acetylglucosamine pyrophosphorylase/glucosamine-1-phosphate N-acetyltransferase